MLRDAWPRYVCERRLADEPTPRRRYPASLEGLICRPLYEAGTPIIKWVSPGGGKNTRGRATSLILVQVQAGHPVGSARAREALGDLFADDGGQRHQPS